MAGVTQSSAIRSRAGIDIEAGGIVRLATLLSVPALLRERGFDPTTVLRSVGLEPAAFDHAENQIPFRTAGQLLALCAETTRCPHFGLLVGQHADVATLGRLGALMRHSPTVDVALRSLILHMHLQNRGGVPTRSVTGDRAMLGYAIYQRDMPGTAQVSDLVAALSYNVMRSICGSKWRPLATTFARALPKDIRPYRRHFGDALLWDQPATTLVFDRTWLDQPLPGSDGALHALLQREVSKESHDSSDVVEQVRVALRTMIPTGRSTELAVATMLTIHSRTLRRQLVVKGTSFRSLANEIRYEIARQLLTDTLMPITEIAGVLEYADVSAFTRAFRRWTDTSPAAWRARTRAETQPAKANPS